MTCVQALTRDLCLIRSCHLQMLNLSLSLSHSHQSQLKHTFTCSTMTLVDLPGMTKVPVGDQPSNIEARIRELVRVHVLCLLCL